MLSKLKRSEDVRLFLTLDTAPTGTPTVTIERQGNSVLTATNMTQGLSNLEWYYDYTTDGAATVGTHQVRYTAVIDGVTRYGHDTYDQTINDIDDVKSETALILTDTNSIQTDTTSIEGKVDTIDTNIDTIKDTDLPAIKDETALIVEDTGTTIPDTLATMDGKIDTIDTNVDTSLTNQTSIEGKVDIIDTNVDTSLVNQTSMEGKIDIIDTNLDTALVDIAAIPTVEEIDTELTTEHGAGAWTATGNGSGAFSVIFNVKDQSANNIMGAYVSVHNAADDDSPVLAWDTATNASGNTETLNIDGDIKVRVKAGNFNYNTSSHTISSSGTVNLTGTAATVSNPTDPDVCRLRIYPLTLENADVADLVIDISSAGKLTKINDQFITNDSGTFTLDTGTVPDSYYFDAIRGATVHVSSKVLGLDDQILVPDEATYDIGTDADIETRI